MVYSKEIKKWSVFWRLTITWNIEQRKVGRWFYPFYECVCSCWTKKFVHYFSLQSGKTKSCWCLLKDKVGNMGRTHGLSGERIYKIRAGLKKRCYNPKCKSFKDYGDRWITVCDEWINNFENFYRDMYPSYEKHVKIHWEKNTTIDRIDNNWSYCKENCRRGHQGWAGKKQKEVKMKARKEIQSFRKRIG